MGRDGGRGEGLSHKSSIIILDGAIVGIPFARRNALDSARTGAVLVILGATITLAGVSATVLPAVAVGAIVGGAGQGAGFGASLRLLSSLSDAGDRGGIFAGVYVVGYVAYDAPVLMAGFLTQWVPLAGVVSAYGIVVALLGAWAFVALARGLVTKTSSSET